MKTAAEKLLQLSTAMNDLVSDVRHSFRGFRRTPLFFFLVTGILGLGIALSVSLFSLVDGVLFRPLPYRNPERLVAVTSYAPKPPFDSNGSVSYRDFEYLKRQSRSFSDMAVTFRTGWSRMTLTSSAEPEPVQGAYVSPNFFAMFGRSPILGRTFNEAENQHTERVIVISHNLWVSRFGSSPDVLGQNLEIGHTQWRVIGVMAADFQVPFLDTQIWAPVLSHPEWNNVEQSNPPERPRWDVMARLKPGISMAQAQAEIDALDQNLRKTLPEFHPNPIKLVPLREHFTGSVRKPLSILLAAVGFLFLIGCANITNLLLVRQTRREGEVAIRAALGAGRGRLIRQSITESLLLSSCGGLLGVLGATAFVPLLVSLSPADIPLLGKVAMNTRGLEVAVGLSIASGLLIGIVSSWRRGANPKRELLSASTRSATEGCRSSRMKNVLVAGEFALAGVLVTASSLLVRSMVSVLQVDVGFRTEYILTVQMLAPGANSIHFYRELEERIMTLPGVQAVGGVSNLFFLDETRTHALKQVEGRPPEPRTTWKPLVWTQITGDYFRVLGIPLLRGRFFEHGDRPDSPPVVIVNEMLARRYWPGEDPIGKRVKGFDPRGKHDDWLTVVGVVGDTRSGGVERGPLSQIYEMQAQRGEPLGNLVIRTTRDPMQLAGSVRSLIHRLSPDTTVSSIRSMDQLVGLQEMQRRFQTFLICSFSVLSLALAALGVFAVMHYTVAARTHELGIRMAVGADRWDILSLILSSGMRVALAGTALGIVASSWITTAFASILFEVKPGDPTSFAAAAVMLFAVALLASYLPARRAARLDPVLALHQN